MLLDVVDLRNFYGDPLGRTVRGILRDAVRAMWPDLTGERLLGLGYATPVLRPFLGEADRTLALMPARLGVVNWPAGGPSATALVHEDDLPLPDASIDRVLMLHCLELADHPQSVLKELWRVLAPGGRLIAIVPSRTSVWARFDGTPFGSGRPFSRGQMDKLLKESLFSPIDWRGALHAPPFTRPYLIRSAPRLERIGRRLWPALAGVVVVEATKQVYQGVPVKAKERRFRMFPPVLVPEPQLGRAGGITGRSARRNGSAPEDL